MTGRATQMVSSSTFAFFVLLCSGLAAARQHAGSNKNYSIVIKKFEFAPEMMEVNVGDTITWKNEDIVPHIVTGPKFKSKSLDQGESWTYTAEQKGEFPYYCRFHPTMKGKVIVH